MSEIPTINTPPIVEFTLGGPFLPPTKLSAVKAGLPPNEPGWAARIDELRVIQSLKDDWDGDGSVAPGADLADGAIALAYCLRKERRIGPPDRVVASVNGTIVFEWHDANWYYEIEVTSRTAAEARWIQNGADEAIVSAIRWTT